MKQLSKVIIGLALVFLTVAAGCARKSCPAYDTSVKPAVVK